jgi:hypothetical protein
MYVYLLKIDCVAKVFVILNCPHQAFVTGLEVGFSIGIQETET